jgi:hypothetical protein
LIVRIPDLIIQVALEKLSLRDLHAPFAGEIIEQISDCIQVVCGGNAKSIRRKKVLREKRVAYLKRKIIPALHFRKALFTEQRQTNGSYQKYRA